MLGRRVLSKEEKQSVLEQHHYQCYICRGDIIHPDEAEFVHKLPLDQGGSFDLKNYVPLHDYCFLKAKEQDLHFARDEAKIQVVFASDYDSIFTERKSTPDIRIDKEKMLAVVDGVTVPMQKCPNTGTFYFYHLLPAAYLESDPAIDPKGMIRSRVVGLSGHLRDHVQMNPVICRWHDGRVSIVSGLHRAAAQHLGNSHLRVDCKVFVDPDEQMLAEAVTASRGILRSAAHKPAPVTDWMYREFRDEINQWRDVHPDQLLTESTVFYDILQLTENQGIRSLESYLSHWIRETESWQRLTQHVKSRSIRVGDDIPYQYIRAFLHSRPADAVLESEKDYRQEEAENGRILLEIILAEGLLAEEEDPAGVLQTQLREDGAAIWTRVLADAFRIIVQRNPAVGICYGPLFESMEMARMTQAVRKMFRHPFWQDLDLDRALREGNRAYVENSLTRWGLNHTYLLHG